MECILEEILLKSNWIEMKSEIRNRIKEVRALVLDKDSKSSEIILKLKSLSEFQKALVVMSYVSTEDEVDTMEFIHSELSHKRIVVPFIDSEIFVSEISSFDSLIKGKLGVLEPKQKNIYTGLIDICIIPGIAFDLHGGRIGYGKGFYDKFLGKNKCLKIGLCFSEQIVDKIPVDSHDIPVDIIITDKEIIRIEK